MTRRRLRSIILCTGTTLCILSAAAFVLSGWWELAFQQNGVCAILSSGVVVTGIEEIGAEPFYASRREFGLTLAATFPSDWDWEFPNPGTPYLIVPFYAPFFIVAIPTLLVWRFVPKFPRGHCRRCGYNLTGLTEARCPECGTGFGQSSN